MVDSACQLSLAPVLDVTPFGPGWIAQMIRPLNAPADLVGSGTSVVSNRSGPDRSAVISLELTSASVPLVLRISAPGYGRSVVMPGYVVRRIHVPVHAPARSVTLVRFATRSLMRAHTAILEFTRIDVRSAQARRVG